MKKILTLALTCFFISTKQLHASEVIELYHACKSGNVGAVARRIHHGKKLLPLYHANPCYFAAYYNHLKLVQYLIEQCGYDADGEKNEEYTPLIGTAIHGSKEVAQFLINAGADVNKLTPAGATPLHFAAESGHLGITQLLIEAGADVQNRMLEGITPLYLAAQHGNLNVLEHLIEMGADVHKARQDGCTPLHVAACNGHHEIIQLLIRHGADIKALFRNKTPFQLAIEKRKVQAAQYLIRAHAAVTIQDLENARDKNCFVEIVSGIINFLQDHREELAKYQTVLQNEVNAHRFDIHEWLTTEQGKLCATISHLLFSGFITAHQNFFETGSQELIHISWLRRSLEEKKLAPNAMHRVLNQYLSMPEPDKNVTDLHAALSAGDLDTVKELIPNEQIRRTFCDYYGKTPLHLAVQMNQYELVRLLVEKKIDHVNCTLNNSSWSAVKDATPLYLAAQLGHDRIAQFLVNSGADVDRATQNGFTPLQVAAHNGQDEIVRILLEAGASANKARYNGATPLYMAAAYNFPRTVKLLIDTGAEVDKAVLSGKTPLWNACRNGHEEVVNILLKAGAQPDKPDNTGTTPLNIAYQAGHHSVIKLLLDHGASVDQPLTEKGRTLLHRAAENSNLELIQLAIKADADVNAAMSTETTPLYRTAHDGNHEVVDILLKADAQPDKPGFKSLTPLNAAMIKGHKKVIKLLLDHGAHVNQPLTKDGATLLYLAAERGNLEVVQFAIQANADVNKPRHGGFAPLHVAAYCGHEEIVRFLIQAGGDIHKADNVRGATPLHFAAFFGHLAMIKTLIHAGASTDMTDAHGATPLYLALIQGHLDVASLLIRRGARVTTNDLERASRSGFNLQDYSTVYRQELSALLSITQLNEEAINTILAYLAMPRFY